jgi:probable rRNA maturation factor
MASSLIDVQFGTGKSGVPHASSLRQWALLALEKPSSRTSPNSSRRNAARTLCVRVIGAAESRKLNRVWRNKDKPTNVLSFPGGNAESAVDVWLGDLAICAPVVAREAREQGKALRAHWAHMVIHGVLHLLGYDHLRASDARTMEALEVKLLARLGFANPYE